MKDSIKNRKKKFLALCLSAMMLSSVAALGACKDSTDTADSSTPSSSSASTSAEKDTGIIKNAGFETFNDKNAINTSATGWSRSVNSTTSGSALSSKAASGIIDLDPVAWNDLTGTNASYNVATMTEEEAEAAWDELTIKDKLSYYDRWKKENKDGKIATDLSFYEAFNIDSGDIPTISHFNTHHKAGEEGYGEDTKVLMIHNEYPESDSTATYKALGTAQKYTSSTTVTVKAGSSAEFSVWVKTKDLQSSSTEGDPQPAVDKGAYISITHSVGGKSLDAYMVENINTENMSGLEETNGWKQYSFLLKGSSYVDTTFSLVLGLGQGGGTYRGDYVNGYAFFDDIECNLISNATYTQKRDAFITDSKLNASDIVGFEHEGESKIVDVAVTPEKDEFALDFYGDFTALDVLANATGKPTTSDNPEEGTVSSVAGSNPASWLHGGFDGSNDVTAVFDNAAAMQTASANNKYLSAVYENYFKDNKFAKDKKVLLLMSANGAAYTADSNYTFQFSGEEDYLAISFFVKTSDLNGYTGAGITLVDGNNKTSFSSIDTSSIQPVEIEGEKDVFDGWQQCFFFVKNASEEASTTFTLSFNYGPTAIEETTTKDNYHPGFAAFTGFQVYSMSEAEYESAQGGTYAKLVSVVGAKEEETTNTAGFDSVAGVPSDAIEAGLAHLQNYKGVYSNSAYITGGIKDSTDYNKHENAGLVSKEYFTKADGYFYKKSYAWLEALKGTETDATTVWNKIFGEDSNRPLLIWNDGSENGKAYGYIAGSTSVGANQYAAVSVRVKVSAGATANIYLIDTDQDKFDTTLSIGRNLTYWYDKDGNICTGDPSQKATLVAFKLQSNGLYLANKHWPGYDEATMKDVWFANLSAYAIDPATKNLLVAETGAKHDYTSHWNDEGEDGIAYYYNEENQTYYADRAKTNLPVKNLADVQALTPRFTAFDAENQKLMATVEDTKGEWKYVTFYIHAGEAAKNYRLEVWSGDRNGQAGATGSYVIFDTFNPGEAEGNFTSLLTQFEDEVKDENKFYGVFSYYDTANYLRYNADLDENGYGNLYKYDPTSPKEEEAGIAYLKHDTEETGLTIFADYQYSEKAVSKSAPETDDDISDGTEEEPAAETNVWLLASSLAVAVILVLAVISIAVRKIIKKIRKNRAMQASMKNKKSK